MTAPLQYKEAALVQTPCVTVLCCSWSQSARIAVNDRVSTLPLCEPCLGLSWSLIKPHRWSAAPRLPGGGQEGLQC